MKDTTKIIAALLFANRESSVMEIPNAAMSGAKRTRALRECVKQAVRLEREVEDTHDALERETGSTSSS